VQVLCTGDVHLGRHPTKIPDATDGDAFSPRTVWQATVATAVDRDVDAVLVSGDLVDDDNRYIEAYGAFEAGATRLDDAGIPTLVVSGNHDHDAVPRLVDDCDLPSVSLLGRDGSWERQAIEQAGDPVLTVDGWSFPDEYVLESPLQGASFDPVDTPRIGLVHGDYDVGDSEYAPLRPRDLAATPHDAWVLGHIHKPDVLLDADPLVFYPGSPQPLDPGEPGQHGPWLLSIDDSGRVEVEQVPLASVRYDAVEVDVSDLPDPRSVTAAISDRVQAFVTRDVDTTHLEHLVVRARLTGRTEFHGELVDQRADLVEQSRFSVGSVSVSVDDVAVETTPAVDLEALAGESSPVGYLADVLLGAEDGEAIDEYEDLVEDVADAVHEARNARPYAPLQRERGLEPPTDDEAVAYLQQQGRLLLYQLREQTEEGT
jgi:exonuclease SbcD